jgi:hypothetical protein
MTAIFILVSNLTATVLGPPLVGLCTDYLFRDPLAIGTALALVCGAAAALAALVLAWGIRPYLQALGRSDTHYAESMAMEGGVA